MSRSILALLILLAALTAFTPPGLCPCWLVADVARYHPHPDGHPEKPHAHNYLNDLFQSQVIVIATLTFITARMLIAILESQMRYALIHGDAAIPRGWIAVLEPPPPRIINLELLLIKDSRLKIAHSTSRSFKS